MKKRNLMIAAVIVSLIWTGICFAKPSKSEKSQKAIVLAVFGTTYPKALKSIIELKQKMEKAFPDIPIHLAFTSKIIRNKWAKRALDPKFRADHPKVPDYIYTTKSPLATVTMLQDQGIRHIAVQSTHVFAGEEYTNLKLELEALASIRTVRERDKPFKNIILGRPALGEPGDRHPYQKDIEKAAKVLAPDVALAQKNNSALVYMGHGNEVFSTGTYIELQTTMRSMYPDVPVYIGTVEGFPGPEGVLLGIMRDQVKKVTLMPLMVVAGDHATNDMVGKDHDSWKSMFEQNGIVVRPVLRGLGELSAWDDIYIDHLKDAMQDGMF